MSLLAPVSIPNLLHLSLCQMLDSCRAVICEENKNKSFVALTRGNSINKTRPFAADLLIVLQCRVFVAHAEILVLAKYREKDRRSPGICRSAAVFVIGLAEYLHQPLHDTRFHISIFTIVAKYWLRHSMHVLCRLSRMCVNTPSLASCRLHADDKRQTSYIEVVNDFHGGQSSSLSELTRLEWPARPDAAM